MYCYISDAICQQFVKLAISKTFWGLKYMLIKCWSNVEKYSVCNCPTR